MIKRNSKVIERRSDCPLSCTLELIGDKWALLIIRDMMFPGKSTYNEFLNADEHIATNILNDKLKKLTAVGIITYTGAAKRKKYSLTKMGMDLKPLLEAVGMFGMKYFEGSKEYFIHEMKEAGIDFFNPEPMAQKIKFKKPASKRKARL